MLQRILVPLDGSVFADQALPHALAVARALDGRLLLLHVLEATPEDHAAIVDPVDWRFRRTRARRKLERTADDLGADGFTVETRLAEGLAADEIVQAARDWPADLLVLTSYGRRGCRPGPQGSTTTKVVAQGRTSVLVVPPASSPALEALARPATYRRILVALDGSPPGDAALGLAHALARPGPAEILLAHVVPVPELIHGATPLAGGDILMREEVVSRNRRQAEAYLDRCARICRRPGLSCRVLLGQSTRVHHTLAGMIQDEQPDLVLLSAHGQGSEAAPPTCPYGVVSGHVLAWAGVPRLVVQDPSTAVAAVPAAAIGHAVRQPLNWAPHP
ncbi:MAG: universal stress protein [Planctomycetota bacterium]